MSDAASSEARVAAYDAWYQTPRGRWIGETEFALLKTMLKPGSEASGIDVGCGTGYFTRLLAREVRGEVVRIDPDHEALHFARARAVRRERYEAARGEALPFDNFRVRKNAAKSADSAFWHQPDEDDSRLISDRRQGSDSALRCFGAGNS